MFNNLNNKRILIGITGGIAAYKILELIRLLKEFKAQVKVILTASGHEFVTPLSIQALNGEKVYSELLSAENESAMSHIDLARWAQVILIAPATANFMAKMRYGLADDLLSTVCLATTSPILIAPAMNQQMWQCGATQDNLNALQKHGIGILGPASGSQACGEVGPGRMLEAQQLLEHLQAHFAPQLLSGRHVLITAGPTQEAIDPVRFITNHSSGKMGYALAAAAIKLGAKVTLISGSTNLTPPPGLNFISVISAQEMYQAVLHLSQNSSNKVDLFIACAAVADYKPVEYQTQKIKKSSANMLLELERTPDMLSAVAQLPTELRPICIGFAAETNDLSQNAINKLQNKNIDFIVANDVGNGKVFNQEDNQVTIFSKHSAPVQLPTQRKEILAYEILQNILHTPELIST